MSLAAIATRETGDARRNCGLSSSASGVLKELLCHCACSNHRYEHGAILNHSIGLSEPEECPEFIRDEEGVGVSL